MRHFLTTRDYAFSQEQFELWHDPQLDMLVTKPVPNDLSAYYESQAYISHTDASASLFEKLYQAVKGFNLRLKVRLLRHYNNHNKKVLDIGAGTGDFLVECKRKHWNVFGIEPNQRARERAKTKGIELMPDWNAAPIQNYGIITLWHVLEHFKDLDLEIQKLIYALDDNGTLIVAVPNYKSYDAHRYKEYWAAYDVPRHISHFSRTSIQRLFARYGMEIVATKPMVFDAFYVALLSERYRSGKSNFLRAFSIALISNIKALRTKEFSSIIFCLKKKQFSH